MNESIQKSKPRNHTVNASKESCTHTVFNTMMRGYTGSLLLCKSFIILLEFTCLFIAIDGFLISHPKLHNCRSSSIDNDSLRTAIHVHEAKHDIPKPRSETEKSNEFCSSRRLWFTRTFSKASLSLLSASDILTNQPQGALADAELAFRSQAYNLKEYTNSIVASKDTNVSPKEAYDVLAEIIAPLAAAKPTPKSAGNRNLNRALDVGAGAGVSTQTLYEMGFTNIDAVDWSGTAWGENVIDCPPNVQFYEMDDERFFQTKAGDKKYQVIVYNFAINFDKAVRVAVRFLAPDGHVLVPANEKRDYWYKQTYYLIDAKGDIAWKSKPDVGAWSVQFQPDVTSDTCQGIWCPPYNGFVKQR